MVRRPRKSGKTTERESRDKIAEMQALTNLAERLSHLRKDVHIKARGIELNVTGGGVERLVRNFKKIADFFRKE